MLTSSGKNKAKGTKPTGFSLIECIMSLGIITAVILYCFIIFSQSYQIIRFGEADLVAMHLAQQQMEFFRSGFPRVPPVGGPYDFYNVPEDYNNINLNPKTTFKNKDYVTKVIVSAVPGCDQSKIRHVIVEVYRPEGTGWQRKITLEGYIAKY